jgi:hypothetical protein
VRSYSEITHFGAFHNGGVVPDAWIERHGRGLSPIKSFGKLPCRFIKPFLVFANVMWADINPYITKICIRRMFYKEVFLLER